MTDKAQALLEKLKNLSTQALENILLDEDISEKTIKGILDITEKTARKMENARNAPIIDMEKIKEEIVHDGIVQYSITFEPIHRKVLEIKYPLLQEMLELNEEDFLEIELIMLRKTMFDANTFSIKLMEKAGPLLDNLMNDIATEFTEAQDSENENHSGCNIYQLNDDTKGMTKN